MVTARLSAAIIGSAAAIAVLFAPAYQAAIRPGLTAAASTTRTLAVALRWQLPPAAAAVTVIAVGLGPLIAVGAAAATAASVSILRTAGRVRRLNELVDSLSSLCTLIASQAEAAPTVTDAIIEAAEWATGPAAPPFAEMASGVVKPGLPVAAQEFASRISHPLGRSIAETIVTAQAAGAQWAIPIEALAGQASDTASTLRSLRRQVTSRCGVVVIAALMSTGLLVSVRFVAPDAAQWFSTGRGQLVVVAVAGIYTAMLASLGGRVTKEASW